MCMCLLQSTSSTYESKREIRENGICQHGCYTSVQGHVHGQSWSHSIHLLCLRQLRNADSSNKTLIGKRRTQSIPDTLPAPLWPIIIMEKNTKVDKSWKIPLRQSADTVCLTALEVCSFPSDGFHTREYLVCVWGLSTFLPLNITTYCICTLWIKHTEHLTIWFGV